MLLLMICTACQDLLDNSCFKAGVYVECKRFIYGDNADIFATTHIKKS